MRLEFTTTQPCVRGIIKLENFTMRTDIKMTKVCIQGYYHCFWDTCDYLQNGKTINGAFATTIKRRDQSKTTAFDKVKSVVFQQDNAMDHNSVVVLAKIHKSRLEFLPYLRYLSDLTPCDFHLFPNLKK